VRIDTDYLITASGVRHGVTMIHDVQLYTWPLRHTASQVAADSARTVGEGI
jgi:hypothetical protein